MPHKKGHKKTMRRKVKKGGFYGASGAIAPGAMQWSRGSEMGGFSLSSRGGNAIYGSGRKRSRKATRKVRRGGSKFGAVSASFQGEGSRGMIDVKGVDTKGAPPGSAAQGAFNDFGAKRGDFSSFVKAA
jgi:hypothetical protein